MLWIRAFGIEQSVSELRIVYLRRLALLLLPIADNGVENVVVFDLHLAHQAAVHSLNEGAVVGLLQTGISNEGEEEAIEKD